jgi:hypothetical protein
LAGAAAFFVVALVREGAAFAERAGFFAPLAAFFLDPERAGAAFFGADGLARVAEPLRAAGAARLADPPFFAAGAAFFTAVKSTSFEGPRPGSAPPERGANRPPRPSMGG